MNHEQDFLNTYSNLANTINILAEHGTFSLSWACNKRVYNTLEVTSESLYMIKLK